MAHIEGIVFPEKRVFEDPPGLLIIPRLFFHGNRQKPVLFPSKEALGPGSDGFGAKERRPDIPERRC
jgi:hypothetical protein